MILTSNDLAQMRSDIEALLPDTCSILTATNAPDGMGGIVITWGTAYKNVKCRLDASNYHNSEQTAGAAVRPVHSYVLTVPYDTVIDETNRVVVGSGVYSVVSLDTNKSWATCRRAFLERV